MAKIRGYIDRFKITSQTVDKFKELVGDIFSDINITNNTLRLVLDSRNIEFTNFSDYLSKRAIIKNGNNKSYGTTVSEFIGKCVVYETDNGIMISLGSCSSNAINVGGIINIVYNKSTDVLCLSSGASPTRANYEMQLSPVTITAYTAKGSTLLSYAISTTGSPVYTLGTAVSPYPVVTEIVHDNEPTGIYALTQGQLMNATVSDGDKNIFVSNVLGLED